MARDRIGAGQEVLTSLEGVLITPELQGRPSRPPDYERQARALDVLATALAEAPGDALQELVEVIVELCDAGSAGVSLVEQEAGAMRTFRWAAVAGAWADKRGGRMPIDASPCGVVVARNTALLFAHPEQHFAAAKVEPLISEILLVPLHADGRPIGTIWVIAHDPARRFDREDARLLLSLSRLTGAMAQTTASLAAARESEASLRRLNTDLERQVAARSRERSLLWQHTLDLLSVIDLPSATFERVNPAWTTLLGWTAREMEGRPYAEFVHPEDLAASAAAFEAVRRGDPVLHFENRYRSRDGDWRRLSWAAVPEGDKLYSTTRDVTVERTQAEALAQAEEALRQSQKMETVGQLTGGVAHDFNNLLQIVTGNLEVLQRNLPPGSPRLKRAAESAMTGAKRAATLTQRLLAFSRRQALAPKPIDANKLVSGMSELLHRTLGETIELATVLASGLWRVEADPNQLENALLNLAVNARDAMPDGGKLTIETSNTHLDRGYAAQNAEVTPGQYVAICVFDTGTGMDDATVARVFEPFFTTKEVGKGTGLGLSMVYGFVRQSGGHVKISSELGHGTTVKVYLPRLLGSKEEETESSDILVPEGTREETILVCEDDDDVRAYSVEVLRELGYRVLEAHDGPSALRLLRRQEGRVDLLFSDVVLPGGMTGADLAADARLVRPELKVLFTTGYARDAIVHHGRLDAGVELITKPFAYAELAVRVRDVLDA